MKASGTSVAFMYIFHRFLDNIVCCPPLSTPPVVASEDESHALIEYSRSPRAAAAAVAHVRIYLAPPSHRGVNLTASYFAQAGIRHSRKSLLE